MTDFETMNDDDGGDDERGVLRDEMETSSRRGACACEHARRSGRVQTFIRADRHPLPSPFCTGMKGITRKMVADAPVFPDSMEELPEANARPVLGPRLRLLGLFGQ